MKFIGLLPLIVYPSTLTILLSVLHLHMLVITLVTKLFQSQRVPAQCQDVMEMVMCPEGLQDTECKLTKHLSF